MLKAVIRRVWTDDLFSLNMYLFYYNFYRHRKREGLISQPISPEEDDVHVSSPTGRRGANFRQGSFLSLPSSLRRRQASSRRHAYLPPAGVQRRLSKRKGSPRSPNAQTCQIARRRARCSRRPRLRDSDVREACAPYARRVSMSRNCA